MLRFCGTLIVILLTFAACSQPGDPVLPDGQNHVDIPGTSVQSPPAVSGPSEASTGHVMATIWGAVEMSWDPSTGDVAIISRSGEVTGRHYKVSGFLSPPNCSDCITATKSGGDPAIGTGSFDVTLRNPTGLSGYEVRGVVQIQNGVDLRILNADGYTNLFGMAGYESPAPFRTYAELTTGHAFSAGTSHTESFEVKTNQPSFPINFRFIVTAGYPTAPGDVSRLSKFNQSGQLLPGGGTATISFLIEDLQDDITSVCLRASQLGAGDVWLSESGGRWGAVLTNLTGTPGIHELRVDANSPNSQGAVTSHYYRAVVFHSLGDFRTQLLSLLNVDRVSNGLQALVIDAELNTVAQFHGQDMADKQYFSHTNLDGWTPWRRMDYYGVDYGAAGENIAVGYDTPSEVETAWMNSPGHKANILNGSFNQVGLGIVPTQTGDPYAPGYYWVQLFTN